MSRTQDLLGAKWSGGAEAPRSPAGDAQPTARQSTTDGGSRTRQLLAGWTASGESQSRRLLEERGRDTTTAQTTAKPAAETTQTAAPPRQRDDAAVRNNFGARHPEYTGGELGEIIRGLNSGKVYIEAGQKELAERKAAYEADPTQENRDAFNTSLAGVQQHIEDYGGYVERYRTYYSPEECQKRIDAMNAEIAALETEKAIAYAEKMRGKREKTFNQRARGLGGGRAGTQAAQKKMDAADQRYEAADRKIQDIEKKIAQEQEVIQAVAQEKARAEREAELLRVDGPVSRDQQLRDNFAAKNSEMTGGAAGERTRAINTALVNAQVERDRAKEEMEQAYSELHSATGALHDASQASRDAYEAAKTYYNECDAKVTELAKMEYIDRNDRAFAKMAADGEAAANYDAANVIVEDRRKLTEVIGYLSSGQGDAGAYTQNVAYLTNKYGVSESDIVTYSRGEEMSVSDDGTIIGPVAMLFEKLEQEMKEKTEAMKAAGYNFFDMRGYAQRLEDQRTAAQQARGTAAFAQEHPILASAGTILVQPFRVLDVLSMDWGHGTPGQYGYVPPDTSNMIASNYVDTVRGTVSAKIAENTDWELWGVNVASFAYNVGVSTMDSAVVVTALGPGAVYLMGANAAVSTSKEIVDRGGTAEQAIWGGLAAGAAEVFFEKVSVENLLKHKSITGWKSFVRETLKQGGIEASEEMCTEIANILSDTAIMGANSDFAQAVKRYESQGMSEEQAKRSAYLDMVGRVGWAGAGGFISGVTMGGFKAGIDYAGQQYNQYLAQMEDWARQMYDGQQEYTDTVAEAQKTAPADARAELSQMTTGSSTDVDSPVWNDTYGGDTEQQTAETQTATSEEGEENRLLSSEDLEGYLAVGERKHVRDLKQGQLRTGEKPIMTTIEQIKSFIRSAISGDVRDTIKGYGKVGSRMASDLQTAGVDVTGYYLELDANRLWHLSDHIGDDGDPRNIPLTEEQAENLTNYIDTYDDVLDVVRYRDGGVRILLGKKINGHSVVVVLVSKGRKSIQPVTAWQNDTEHYLRKYGHILAKKDASH